VKGSGDGLGKVFGPVLDGGVCTAVYPGSPNGAPANRCADGLNLGTNATPIAYSQRAKANSNAESGATASVAPISVPSIDGGTLDLDNVITGITSSNTSQVIDAVTGGNGAIKAIVDALKTAGLYDPLVTNINAGLQQILNGLAGAVNVELRIGAVESFCTATPDKAQGNGTVDGIHLLVTLGGESGTTIDVNIPVGTDPNSQLVGSVPDITNQLLAGVAKSLQDNHTLDGALAPLGAGIDQIRQALYDNLLSQLKDPLTQLGDGLAPIIKGTVNEQVDGDGDKVSHTVTEKDNNDPKITVTALDVVLFGGTPLEGRLELGKVSCGKNIGGNNGGPGLQFDKDADTDHGDAKFTLTVKNATGDTKTDVFVQDFYGKDIDAKDVKDVKVSQGTFDKSTGRWNVGTLAAGATAKLTFKVDVSKSDLDDGVKNAACVNKSSKPDHIQKNHGVSDDTDGCDEATAQKDKNNSDSDSDSDHGPKSVDSGLNDGGNVGPLAIAGLLAASTLIGSAARQRLLLDR
jgi:hypothetical protein